MRLRACTLFLLATLCVALGLLASPACYGAEYGDVTLARKAAGMDEIPPAIFPHWIHRMQYKCGACHDEPFKMKAGSADAITMDAIQEGKWCGACHDGKAAFSSSSFETCPRCHHK
jgi:c(7)-type cytochrome triheme protein